MSTVRWSGGGPFAILPEALLDADVSDRAIRLYAMLARYADKDGAARPFRRTLAQRLKCSLNTLDRAVNELVRIGALTIESQKRDDGGATANRYVLHPSLGGPTPSVGRPPSPPMPQQELEPFLNESSEPNGSAQTMVAYFVDQSRASGSDPPKRVKGQLAKLVGEMLSEGIEPARVKAGIDVILERGLHPSVLPSAVHEASLKPGARASPKPTGWRFVRGTHGTTYVQDPEGTDIPPRGYA